MAHVDRSQLLNYLQLKKIINQSEYRPTEREIEVLALGLEFVPRKGVVEYATSLYAIPNAKIVTSKLKTSSLNEKFRNSSQEEGSVRNILNWETLPSIAPIDIWSVNEVYNQPVIVEPSNKCKRRRENNNSDCSITNWKRNEKRYHTSPNQMDNGEITMDYMQIAAVAKMWKDQNMFYLTESDHLPGDSAGVIVLWSREHYRREADRHFSDDEMYELVAVNERVSAVAKEKMSHLVAARNYHLHQLRAVGIIGEETLNELKNSETNEVKMIPYIHFRPKTDLPAHPATGTFQARAVVETDSGPLHALDEYLANLATPITTIMPGILNDSYELVQTTSWLNAEALREDNEGSENRMECGYEHENTSEYLGFASARLCSNDYQNPIDCLFSIDRDRAVEAARQVYEANYGMLCQVAEAELSRPPIEPKKFETLLRFIFDNWYISFRHERLYRQKIGLPLGSRSALFVANSFIYMLTRKAIDRPPPWLIAFHHNFDKCLFFGCFHPIHGKDVVKKLIRSFTRTTAGSMKFKIIDSNLNPITTSSISGISREINFMDLTLSFHPEQCPFVSRANESMCLARSFVHRASNHSREYFKNELVAELNRIKKLSSTESIFRGAAYQLFNRLCTTRGYSNEECSVSLKIVEIDRS